MSYYSLPGNDDLEPNQGSIKQWLDNLYSKFQPVEQQRWNQANIDTLFYAGSQSYVNQYFNFALSTKQNYYFNLIQQPINLITGYERQHRKQVIYQPTENSDALTTDQYTKLITHVSATNNIYDQKSKAKELSSISGMVLAQPYLDFINGDQAQGELKIKVWEYNSFLVDPFFREPDMSDAQFVWCQEYISKQEAEERFPDQKDRIMPMSGSPQRYGRFYFLPENYNMSRNDLLVLSYVWYKWRRKKQRLYSRSTNQFFDFSDKDNDIQMVLSQINDLELVTVDVPTWKVAVVLNDQLMFQGVNPLGFDGCPFVPYYWNYDPHINHYDLRVRSLVKPMRDPQFLYNYKIINNNDIQAATINAGWKRKVGAVANEDNLKKTGQGWDVIINDGYELSDVEKIIPSAVPSSDLEMANQMADLLFKTSGVDLENWSGQQDPQIASLTLMMKQAANLTVFQKYFDQWDTADKILGERCLQIVLNNWSAEKVALYIGEEPSPHFYSKIFAKYRVLVEEADLTPTQQNLQAKQMLEMNAAFGREVFPPSMIIPKMNITGKGEIIPFLQQQEQQASVMQQEQQMMAQTFEQARLQELYSKAASNIALARERHGRSQADLGLFEERLSEISRNRALATRDKMEALEKLIDVIAKYGELEAALKMQDLQEIQQQQVVAEDREKVDAKMTDVSNQFMNQVLSGAGGQSA